MKGEMFYQMVNWNLLLIRCLKYWIILAMDRGLVCIYCML